MSSEINMTCFWDGIRQQLQLQHVDNVTFITTVQQYNTYSHTKDILWNGLSLSDRNRAENYYHIKYFDPKSINDGYHCSTCDPFLILIAVLFRKNIEHLYQNTLITYTLGPTFPTIKFRSNHNHVMTV